MSTRALGRAAAVLVVGAIGCGASAPICPATAERAAAPAAPQAPTPRLPARALDDLTDQGPFSPLHVERLEQLVASGSARDSLLLVQLVDAEWRRLVAERTRGSEHPELREIERRIRVLSDALDHATTPRIDTLQLRTFVSRHWVDAAERKHAAADKYGERHPARIEAERWLELWERLRRALPDARMSESPASALELLGRAEAERLHHPERGPNHPERSRSEAMRKHAKTQLAGWQGVDCSELGRELDQRLARLQGFSDAEREHERDASADEAVIDQLATYRASLDKWVHCSKPAGAQR